MATTHASAGICNHCPCCCSVIAFKKLHLCFINRGDNACDVQSTLKAHWSGSTEGDCICKLVYGWLQHLKLLAVCCGGQAKVSGRQTCLPISVIGTALETLYSRDNAGLCPDVQQVALASLALARSWCPTVVLCPPSSVRPILSRPHCYNVQDCQDLRARNSQLLGFYLSFQLASRQACSHQQICILFRSHYRRVLSSGMAVLAGQTTYSSDTLLCITVTAAERCSLQSQIKALQYRSVNCKCVKMIGAE